jgi:predicted HTH transcriptional regulator
MIFKISKGKRDITTFIEALLYTISLTAIEVSKEFKETHIRKVKRQGALEISLNPRQIQALDYVNLNHKITRNKYTKIMGISFMTSYRDLQEMVAKGYLKQKGRGRASFYVLAKREDN